MLAKGYHVIPQKVYGTSPCHRLLYLKEHGGVYKTAGAGGEDEDGDVQGHTFGKGKTLFVGNVDDQGGRLSAQVIEGRLRRIFASCGSVDNVHVGRPARSKSSWAREVTRGGEGCERVRVAHISFASTKGVKNALALTYATSVAPDCNIAAGKEVDEDRDSDGNATCGYAALRQRHRALFPSRKRLQEDVDSRMEEFDRNVAVQESERDKLAAQGEDDDGFVTVTYKKNKRGRMTGGTGARLQQVGEENERVKKKRKGAEGLPDFYRFQVCTGCHYGLTLLTHHCGRNA
ncbi:unnamed protein product [Choristocarpus tenellus]